jgi:hypothetical protein
MLASSVVKSMYHPLQSLSPPLIAPGRVAAFDTCHLCGCRVDGGKEHLAQPSDGGEAKFQPRHQERSAASPNEFPNHSRRSHTQEGAGINATELGWSEAEGRHLVAASSIHRGEEILCEAARVVLPLGRHRRTVCLHTSENTHFENLDAEEAQWWGVGGF